jgi:hypothetical protein
LTNSPGLEWSALTRARQSGHRTVRATFEVLLIWPARQLQRRSDEQERLRTSQAWLAHLPGTEDVIIWAPEVNWLAVELDSRVSGALRMRASTRRGSDCAWRREYTMQGRCKGEVRESNAGSSPLDRWSRRRARDPQGRRERARERIPSQQSDSGVVRYTLKGPSDCSR